MTQVVESLPVLVAPVVSGIIALTLLAIDTQYCNRLVSAYSCPHVKKQAKLPAIINIDLDSNVMNKVLSSLNENLQMIYRKAVDADNALDALQTSGNGKFTAIFPDDTVFNAKSKRFLPYVQEVTNDIEGLRADDEDVEKQLPLIVKKIELLLTTLIEFKQQV
ncbi:MAG: hypothetical protein AAGJ37_16280 [Pseudomonadota bacterium]